MLAYLARRLAFAVVTVVAASLVSFLLVHASGSSPGEITAGAGATAAQVAAANRSLGWDQPLATQYLTWLGHAASGNLGVSLIDGHNIWSDLINRLPVTASIAVFATVLSGIFGVVIGVAAAVRGGLVRRIVTVGSGVALSLPQFWIGIVLVYLVAIKAGLLPATGYVPFSTSPAQYLQSLALPVITLAITGTAIIARTTCTGMTAALRQEHIAALRALGTPPWRIRYVHALRFAAGPVVSVLGIQFIALFGGSVIIEQIFALPGLGQAAQNAIGTSDFPAVQGVVVVATVVVVITNLVLDLVLAALDPKVRTS
jgi:peptide/nickel transport system permease protein